MQNGSVMVFEKWKWRRLEKKIEALPPDKKAKLKEILVGYQEGRNCIHGVPYTRNIPCLDCMGSGDLADVLPFL